MYIRRTSLELLCLLMDQNASRAVLRTVAKEIPTKEIDDAFLMGKISSLRADDILHLQQESDNWILRAWKQILDLMCRG